MDRRMLCAIVLQAGVAAAVAVGADAPAEPVPRKTQPLYQEVYRPQFHYTVKKGWINDPIGLVYYRGEYHLFNDHNPFSCNFPGGKTGGEQSHWSHAVSTDLVHWKQLPVAVRPDALGACWSGSGAVDWNNTSGLQSGKEKTLVLVYTSAGKSFGQSLVYSNDRGRTWKKFQGNPVLPQLAPSNRDPKVFRFRHEATEKWIMVLYLGRRSKFAVLGSADLRHWERMSDLDFPDGHECPELFALPVDGRPENTRWVAWEAGGRYMIGRFDGRKFTPETGVLRSEWGKNSYAGQTFNGAPDRRRIFIAWMAGGKYPDMPFNQQMTFPRRFTLRTTDEGIRLFASPVDEIEKIRGANSRWIDLALRPGDNPLATLDGRLWDIDAAIEPGDAETVVLDIRGAAIRYDRKTATFSCLGKSVRRRAADGP